MKKRCTNSACRKIFRADNVCPYCGKIYPRIPSAFRTVKLEGYQNTTARIRTVRVVRELTRTSSILEAKKIVDECPCIISGGLSVKEAQRWCEELNKVGAQARIV